jgi:hypothetical protein
MSMFPSLESWQSKRLQGSKSPASDSLWARHPQGAEYG